MTTAQPAQSSTATHPGEIMSEARYILIQRNKNGDVVDVFWPVEAGRLYTEAEALADAETDNAHEGDHRSVVAEVGEVGA